LSVSGLFSAFSPFLLFFLKKDQNKNTKGVRAYTSMPKHTAPSSIKTIHRPKIEQLDYTTPMTLLCQAKELLILSHKPL
jgi:hypothetical protein